MRLHLANDLVYVTSHQFAISQFTHINHKRIQAIGQANFLPTAALLHGNLFVGNDNRYHCDCSVIPAYLHLCHLAILAKVPGNDWRNESRLESLLHLTLVLVHPSGSGRFKIAITYLLVTEVESRGLEGHIISHERELIHAFVAIHCIAG
uniref:Uncharacterized protein n=1 Tax=Escherichia phage vB_Henu5_2 TaxID=3350565 RepID=A0AB74UPU2_9CAUD